MIDDPVEASPSRHMLTREEVVWGYRFILGRDPESDEMIAKQQINNSSIADLRTFLLGSPEFVRNTPPLDNLATFPGYRPEELSVFDAFASAAPQPSPGFVTDFHGSRVRISSLWDGVKHLDGLVLPRPVPADYHAETIEWLGLLKSALTARDHFVAMELGAGIGPWLVAGAVAARLRGIHDLHLCGVEGDPGRFALMQQHFRDNGIDPDQHSLFQAGVGIVSGMAKWPRLQDYRNVAGARPIRQTGEGDNSLDDRDLDYVAHMSDEFVDIDVIGIRDLLVDRPAWDFVHMDVQGTEVDLCRCCADLLSERVRYLVVGTHSRKLDGDLLEIMLNESWILENEKPCQFVFKADARTLETMTTLDGTQVWRNPRL
jgi:hypothetical protein